MRDETAHVLLDANSLMHFRRPDQIDWLNILKCGKVNLIITPVLLRELEEQKVKNRSRKLRDRAQAAIGWMGPFIETPIAPVIRTGVSLTFVRHSPQVDFKEHKLSHAIADDELIASAIEYQSENNCLVVIFTADMGLRLKLPAHKLQALVPSNDLKLPDEPDEVEKENSKLKAELARHQGRLPKLRFAFIDGSRNWALPCFRARVERLEPEPPPLFGLGDREYPNYLSEFTIWKSGALFSTRFSVRLENVGNAVATNIKIEMQFPDLVRAVALSDPPKVPNFMTMAHLRDFNIPIPSEDSPTYGENLNAVSFELNNLVHNRTFKSDAVFLRFTSDDAIQNFSSDYLITCVESPEPIMGVLHFTVAAWIAPNS